MPRTLKPPSEVRAPVSIVYDKTMAPAARDTWIQLRGLAWGANVTPELSMTDFSDITGKSASTLYGHLAYLRNRGVLVYAPAGDGKLKIAFTVPDDNSRILEGNNDSADSEKLELPLTPSSLNRVNDPIKEKDIVEFQNSGKKPIGRKASKADPRTSLPAIQCVKSITSRYPPKELYDDIIRVLGERPDRERLEACRKEWMFRGYNPNGLAWALEWYQNGIPERNGRAKSVSPQPTRPAWTREELDVAMRAKEDKK